MKKRILVLGFLFLFSCADKKEVLPLEGREIAFGKKESFIQNNDLNFDISNSNAKQINIFNGVDGGYSNVKYEKLHSKHVISSDNVVVKNNKLYFCSDGKIKIYDLDNNVLLKSIDLRFEKTNFKRIFISSNDKFVAIINDLGEIIVLNQQDNEVIRKQFTFMVQKVPLIINDDIFILSMNDIILKINISNNSEWKYKHLVSGNNFSELDYDNLSSIKVLSGEFSNHLVSGFSNGDVLVIDYLQKDVYFVIPDTSTKHNKNLTTTPIFDGNNLYIAKNSDGVSKFDIKNKKLLWSNQNVKVMYTPIVINNYLFAISDDMLVCLNALNGEILYKKNKFNNATSINMFNNKIFISDIENVYIINPKNGEIENNIRTDDFYKTKTMFGMNDKLFIVKEGTLYIYT